MIPLLFSCLLTSLCIASDTSKKIENVATLFCQANAYQESTTEHSINADPIESSQSADEKWKHFTNKLRKKTHRRSNTIVGSDVMYGSRWDANESIDNEKKPQ